MQIGAGTAEPCRRVGIKLFRHSKKIPDFMITKETMKS